MNKIKALIELGLITDNDVHMYINEQQFQQMIKDGEFDHMVDDAQSASQNELLSIEEDEEDSYDSFPEYVIASTATHCDINETMVFPATEDGRLINFNELAVLSERYGHVNWDDKDATIALLVHPEYKYVFVRELNVPKEGVSHSLYRRTTLEDMKNEAELNGLESQTFE